MATLVTFFSAKGHTAKIAKEWAEKIGADIFEIVPEKPYTTTEILWMNPLARCNREQFSDKEVPLSAAKVEDFAKYYTVYIGFPIWYGAAPKVVNSFCKSYDWSGKKVHAFATSGGSGIGKTAEKLKPFLPGAQEVDAKLVKSVADLD